MASSSSEGNSGDGSSRSKSGGNFRERLLLAEEMEIKEFENPWNFFHLFMSDDETVYSWLRANGLLASSIVCRKSIKVGNDNQECRGLMLVKKRAGCVEGSTFRCENNRNHEKTVRSYSFFEGSHLLIPDIMAFIKFYLDKMTLLQCAKFSGVAYKSTAVHWGSFIRELFKEYFYRTVMNKKISGEIEIDESLFGRKMKYHKGNPGPGLRIWIFGMVDRNTNTIILYPVSDRSKETLIPLIVRHVEPGSTIYSDGWSSYCDLNNIGYKHFTVLHKYAFTKVYVNQETMEEVVVHTNRIEGAWKHAKEHFKKMSGTRLSQFEGHLSEVMWRSHVKGDVYDSFFQLLRSVYTLDDPAQYLYTTPLFDSWHIDESQGDTPMANWNIMPTNTDAESEREAECTRIEVSSDSDSDIPPNRPRTSLQMPGSMTRTQINRLFSSSSSDEEEHDKTLTEAAPSTRPVTRSKSIKVIPSTSGAHPKTVAPSTSGVRPKTTAAFTSGAHPKTIDPCTSGARPKTTSIATERRKKKTTSTEKKTRTDKVCHPKGYAEKKTQEKKKPTLSNVYSKSAFQWEFSSSDEDFQD